MYFFLKHLALADMLVASNIVPQLLYVIMQDGYYLSTSACIFHYYVFNLLGIVQSFILTIMSYDRYLAICNPLHYSSLMTVKKCHYLVNLTWLLTLMLDSTEIGFMYQMKFCDSNIIDHFFCDITSILNISTSDTIIIVWQDFALSLITFFFHFCSPLYRMPVSSLPSSRCPHSQGGRKHSPLAVLILALFAFTMGL